MDAVRPSPDKTLVRIMMSLTRSSTGSTADRPTDECGETDEMGAGIMSAYTQPEPERHWRLR